jgi:hypothetical protein
MCKSVHHILASEKYVSSATYVRKKIVGAYQEKFAVNG